MKLYFLLGIGFSCLLAAEAYAAKPLSREEAVSVLNGNSIIGDIQGLRFVQYFAPNGQTVYQRASGVVEVGQWRVTDAGEVCTLWQGGVSACYKVQANVGTLEWIGPLDINKTDVFSRTMLRPNNLTSVPMPTAPRSVSSVRLGDVVSGFLEIY